MDIKCNCSSLSKIESAEEIMQMENEMLEEVEVDGKRWRTLYRCKQCKTFWEERYTGGRWDGTPELLKVSKEYVSENWRLNS